jgi:endonuclease/exonuclease/phosphatase family metal-dependent hydrolase
MFILNWNFERRPPHSRQAATMMQRIAEQQPDLVCLTEAHAGSTLALGGYEVADRGATWSFNRREGERLVVLWSPCPWREVDSAGNEGTATGGYLSGVTDTRDGPVRVMGICAPHHAASPVGAREKARMWTEQVAFWSGLAKLVADRERTMPTILLGDFNQYVPRIWGAKSAHAALLSALADLSVATGGLIAGINGPTIDHLAHSPDLRASEVLGLSRFDAEGRALSDHFGVAVRLERPDE